MPKTSVSKFGFTLIELMISMSVGLLVLGAAVEMYSHAVKGSALVSQRAALQQDARAASDLLTEDISLAGAGMPSGGLALASGAIRPNFGCDVTSGKCHLGASNNAAVNFPTQTGDATVNYLYGVIPGCGLGPVINAADGATDVITVDYSDSTFLLSDYKVQFNDANGASVTFILPNPAPSPQDQAVNNNAVGLKKGDLVLFKYQTTYAVGEVTADPSAGAGPYTISFSDPDQMKMNQAAATSGNLAQLISACVADGNCTLGSAPTALQVGATASRIFVITYYIDNSTGTPRLMREVNAQSPVPVADNVQNLRFDYSTYDETGAISAAPSCAPADPSQIRTINLKHLTLRSQSNAGTNGYQGIDMQTSVSARNLSFSERYSITDGN